MRKVCVAGWGEFLTQKGSKSSRIKFIERAIQGCWVVYVYENLHQRNFTSREIEALAPDQLGDVCTSHSYKLKNTYLLEGEHSKLAKILKISVHCMALKRALANFNDCFLSQYCQYC